MEERWNPLNPRALERGGRHTGGFRALFNYFCHVFVPPCQGCLPTCNERSLQGNCPFPGWSTNSPQPSGRQLHGKHVSTSHLLHVARVFWVFPECHVCCGSTRPSSRGRCQGHWFTSVLPEPVHFRKEASGGVSLCVAAGTTQGIRAAGCPQPRLRAWEGLGSSRAQGVAVVVRYCSGALGGLPDARGQLTVHGKLGLPAYRPLDV